MIQRGQTRPISSPNPYTQPFFINTVPNHANQQQNIIPISHPVHNITFVPIQYTTPTFSRYYTTSTPKGPQTQTQVFPKYSPQIHHYPTISKSIPLVQPQNLGYSFSPIKILPSNRTSAQILASRLNSVQELIKSKDIKKVASNADDKIYSNSHENSKNKQPGQGKNEIAFQDQSGDSAMIRSNRMQTGNGYSEIQQKSRVWQLMQQPPIYCSICERQIHSSHKKQHQQYHKSRIQKTNVDIPDRKYKKVFIKLTNKKDLVDIFVNGIKEIQKKPGSVLNSFHDDVKDIPEQDAHNKRLENQSVSQQISQRQSNPEHIVTLTKPMPIGPPKQIISPQLKQLQPLNQTISQSTLSFQLQFRQKQPTSKPQQVPLPSQIITFQQIPQGIQKQADYQLPEQHEKQQQIPHRNTEQNRIQLPILIEHGTDHSQIKSRKIYMSEDDVDYGQYAVKNVDESKYIQDMSLDIIMTNQKKKRKLPSNKLAF